jgi:hypothetical protein
MWTIPPSSSRAPVAVRIHPAIMEDNGSSVAWGDLEES